MDIGQRGGIIMGDMTLKEKILYMKEKLDVEQYYSHCDTEWAYCIGVHTEKPPGRAVLSEAFIKEMHKDAFKWMVDTLASVAIGANTEYYYYRSVQKVAEQLSIVNKATEDALSEFLFQPITPELERTIKHKLEHTLKAMGVPPEYVGKVSIA